MLSRLFSMTSRFSWTTTIRFLQFSAKNTVRFGGNKDGELNIAKRMKEFVFRSWGPTMKERLLGPTTGKPFFYGSIALAGASALGIGSLVYYGFSSKQSSILEQSASWSNAVRQKIAHTYSYLLGSIGITASSAFAASRYRPLLRFGLRMNTITLFATVAAVLGTIYLCKEIDYDNSVAKHAAWILQCGLMGAVFAPICLRGGKFLMRAAWYTAGIVAGLSTIAISAPSEKFLKWSGPVVMALSVVIVANIGWLFFPTSSVLGASLASFVVYGSLIVFSVFLLCDTQRVVEEAVKHEKLNKEMKGKAPSFDPINAQIELFLDVLLIFLFFDDYKDIKKIGKNIRIK